MAYKIYGDTYVGSTGKQLKDIKTNADNIIIINNKIAKMKPSVITANGDYNPTINIASDYGEAKLNLYYLNGSNYSDYFDVASSRVRIKSSKVKKVLVSASCLVSRGPSGFVSLYLRKNGTTVAYARHQWVDWNGETLVTVPILIDVSNGDYFELYFGGSKAGNYYQLTYGSKATILTVQAVEVED